MVDRLIYLSNNLTWGWRYFRTAEPIAVVSRLASADVSTDGIDAVSVLTTWTIHYTFVDIYSRRPQSATYK